MATPCRLDGWMHCVQMCIGWCIFVLWNLHLSWSVPCLIRLLLTSMISFSGNSISQLPHSIQFYLKMLVQNTRDSHVRILMYEIDSDEGFSSTNTGPKMEFPSAATAGERWRKSQLSHETSSTMHTKILRKEIYLLVSELVETINACMLLRLRWRWIDACWGSLNSWRHAYDCMGMNVNWSQSLSQPYIL